LKVIQYAYDDFGRIVKIEQAGQQEIYAYDALNRIIAKTLQDSVGCLYAKEAYQFDPFGNQEKKSIWQASDRLAVYRFSYYSDGSLKYQENPLNQRTFWEYDHQYTNALGQQVQARKEIDSLDRPVLEIDDALHRLSSKEIFNGHQMLSCTRFVYDAALNCVKEHATVMADGHPIREYWIERRYNSRGLMEEEKEMPDGKAFLYEYDSMGRLRKKSKPDGVKIEYTYDSLGRVQTITSSDGTIAYTLS
jgi:YD repeat-containing protein